MKNLLLALFLLTGLASCGPGKDADPAPVPTTPPAAAAVAVTITPATGASYALAKASAPLCDMSFAVANIILEGNLANGDGLQVRYSGRGNTVYVYELSRNGTRMPATGTATYDPQTKLTKGDFAVTAGNGHAVFSGIFANVPLRR